jgi:hypothetical protein
MENCPIKSLSDELKTQIFVLNSLSLSVFLCFFWSDIFSTMFKFLKKNEMIIILDQAIHHVRFNTNHCLEKFKKTL